MKTIIGIDPGLNGAAAALGGVNGKWAVLDCLDLPTRPDGSKREIDISAVRAWLLRFRVRAPLGSWETLVDFSIRTETIPFSAAFNSSWTASQLKGAFCSPSPTLS
jgi:hypothetical protein